MMNDKLDEKSNKINDESEIKAIIGILGYFIFGYIFILLFIFILLLIYNFISTLPQFQFIEVILVLIVSLAISLGLIYHDIKKRK